MYLGALAGALAEQAELGLVALDHGISPGSTEGYAWAAIPQFRGSPDRPGLAHRARMLWHWGVRGRPLVVAKHRSRELMSALVRARREFAPQVALVEMATMAQYLPCLRGIPTILTDHEAGAPERAVTGLGATADARDQRLWRDYVRAFYPQATLLQAVTEEDAARLALELGRSVERRQPAVLVPPRPVGCERAPARALFLGDYRHHPNPEAATNLVRDVLPRLRAAEPGVELWLAGPNQERIAHLADTPGVRVLGFVPDLGQLFAQVRVLLAPLYSGGGFRMKSLTALAHGVPVVTNRLGARGVDVPEPARVLAEEPDDLARETLRLLRSRELTAVAAVAAHAWALRTLDAAAVARWQLLRAGQLCSSPQTRPATA